MTLITTSHVREHALAVAAQSKFTFAAGRKQPRFTRVSESFLLAVENNTRQFIAQRVAQHSSKGQTLT